MGYNNIDTSLKEAQKRVLGLQLPTDPRWVDIASMHLDEILTDHAYCEQKATTSCISLIQKYPNRSELVAALSPVVAEEWSHFQLVVAKLNEYGFQLGHQRKDEYVNALMTFVRKGISPDELLLDRLLVCAMIEARSCERFRLLSLHMPDEDLRTFYRKFMIAEAGHYKLFIDLASLYLGKQRTEERWAECLQFEKEILNTIQPRADRMH